MVKEGLEKLLRKGITDLESGTVGLSLEEAKGKYGLSEVVKLASNENPLGPSPKAIEAEKKAAEGANFYPDPAAAELRSVIAETHGVKAEQVLHGNGSSELITFIGEVFINQGDECVIPKPTFHWYQEVSQVMGATNIFSPLREFRIDLEDMYKKTTSKTKLIVIVNPNNPTGDIVRHREVEQFLKGVGKEKIVVFDEAYAEYVDDEDFPRTVEFISQGYPVIVLRTFSKAYGLAGARLGYGISSPEVIGYLNRVRSVFNVNRIVQKAGMEAMRDREHFDRCVRLVWEEKKYYYTEFDKMGLFYLPTFANFIFVKVGEDDLKVHEAMTRRGVIIRPMTPWGYKGFIRVTIGTHDQNEKMISCLKESVRELGGIHQG